MPTFSIVTPVFNTPLAVLTDMIRSVTSQGFPRWELILVDDMSPDPRVLTCLHAAAGEDPRVRVIARDENGGISAASNDGIAAAVGEYLVLLDHDDLLAHGALARVATVLAATPDIDYLYSDEDKIDEERIRFDAFRKPDWSPERLRSQMYCAHLSVLRLALVRQVGGFDSQFDGSQDHDLVLKVTERARRIVHLPEILYHWRALPQSTASSGDAKPYAWEAGRRAVQAHVDRTGAAARVDLGPISGTYALRRQFDPAQLVSVIIPTHGARGIVDGVERVFVVDAVRSVIARAKHPSLEFVIVADDDTPAEVIEELRQIAGGRLVHVRVGNAVSESERCNRGFLASSGETIVMLHDDVEVISDRFIEELCAPLAESSVGMTGAFLISEGGGVLHAGYRHAERGIKAPYSELRIGDVGPFRELIIDREVSGLSGACFAIRRDVFAAVGGFSEQFADTFADADLSFKLRATGFRLLWLNRVKLWHFGHSGSSVRGDRPGLDLLRARWGVPVHDRYLHDS